MCSSVLWTGAVQYACTCSHERARAICRAQLRSQWTEDPYVPTLRLEVQVEEGALHAASLNFRFGQVSRTGKPMLHIGSRLVALTLVLHTRLSGSYICPAELL